MEKTREKSFLNIKSKLMAAVAMLLVAFFMVISSSYAWFTLSTAPEVTGIQTRIGANGNLEIALLYYNQTESEDATPEEISTLLQGIPSAAGSSSAVLGAFQSNKTWGNIVELDLSNYGLDKVTLLPSRLNAENIDGTWEIDSASALLTPTYGSDGRISALQENVLARVYNNGKFDAFGYGVKALGTASNMSAQQLGYNSAKSTITSSLERSASKAKSSLEIVAPKLATIVIDHELDATNVKYDLTFLATMLADLQSANDYLANAIRAYFQTELAKTFETDSAKYLAAVSYLNSAEDSAIISSAKAGTLSETVKVDGSDETVTVTVNATIVTAAIWYETIQGKINAATEAYNDLGETKTEAGYQSAVDVLNKIIIVDELQIGGKKISEYPATADEAAEGEVTLLTYVITNYANGLALSMPTGSGVYADIATAVGQNYSANANIVIDGGVISNAAAGTEVPVKATMATSVESSVLLNIKGAVPAEPAADDTAEKSLTDFYGYAIDLAFRTNAAGSNLMLQVSPTGRIYSESGTAETLGGGSNMTFTVDYTSWGIQPTSYDNVATDEKPSTAFAYEAAAMNVINLMKSIRIVFTDSTGNIVAIAKLEVTDDDTSTDDSNEALEKHYNATSKTVTADVKLYDMNNLQMVVNTPAQGTDTPDDTSDDVAATYLGTTFADPATGDGFKATSAKGAQTLMPLAQNTPTMLTAYVYLDGDSVDNADVATGDISMDGKLNLQFSSDADLTPMEYTPLKNQTTTGGTTTGGSGENENEDGNG